MVKDGGMILFLAMKIQAGKKKAEDLINNLGDKLIYDDFTIQFRIYSQVIISR